MAGSFIATLESSLSFDPQIKPHATRVDAELYMEKVLKDAGWPSMAALNAAQKGSPVLVVDNGDDHTIEIRRV